MSGKTISLCGTAITTVVTVKKHDDFPVMGILSITLLKWLAVHRLHLDLFLGRQYHCTETVNTLACSHLTGYC